MKYFFDCLQLAINQILTTLESAQEIEQKTSQLKIILATKTHSWDKLHIDMRKKNKAKAETERVRVHVTLEKSLLDFVGEYAQKTSRKVTAVFEIAVRMLKSAVEKEGGMRNELRHNAAI